MEQEVKQLWQRLTNGGKEQINGKWYIVCTSHEHMTMIEKTKDGKYAVKCLNGKLSKSDSFKDAEKLFTKSSINLTENLNLKIPLLRFSLLGTRLKVRAFSRFQGK